MDALAGFVSVAKVFGLLVFVYLALLWAASVLWVYRDVRSRSEDATTHIVAVVMAVIFPFAGLGLYLILRPPETLTDAYDRRLEQDALLSELHAVHACPNCRRPVEDDFAMCAYCGTALRQSCGQCGRALLLTWRHCPYCGRPQARPAERRAPAAEVARAGDEQSSGRSATLDAIRRAARTTTDAATARARRPRDADEQPPAEPPRPRRQRFGEDEDDDR